MKKTSLAFIVAGAFACSANASVTNVALGAAVTLNGTFGVGGWGGGELAAASSLVDGIFTPEGQQWDVDSVFWNGGIYPNNSIDIKLSGTYSITGFNVQADNNDTYRIEYRQGGDWVTAWEVSQYGPWGLTTRPAFTLASPIVANELRFTATGGDGYYSVSEIQALAAVPEPEEWAMLLTGGGLVGFQIKRKQQRL